ncbi:NADH-quinone oxidoreductase subunit NuoN [Parvularcula sp. LCG005]|uniref:NADH-quinone oxidoreductase subunit NuoN n=1 Tax=Parvularcula sp. LCG005 TaxID=3078805 RepID=UPI002942C112|nr:NADH-quinone oxidoreductase subunit NuoN [Parvularcula sp. LCG005]WOI54539.1 NADH-quinone oxidoreductase subunit NuoN [Parvularcula sp. LCG005]
MSVLQNDITALAPEVFLAICSMVLLLVGVSLKVDRMREINLVATLMLVVAFAITIFVKPEDTTAVFGGAFAADAFGDLGRGLVYVGAIVALLMSGRFFHREGLGRFEYPVLVLLSVVGMGLMVTATDLISLYMGIELQSLSLYIMAAFNRNSRRSTEAGLKYFVLGALSSGLLLYGSSLIYGFTGTTNFTEISVAAATNEYSTGLVFGLVFLIAGLAFKVSGAPFHMWTPDVYEGSPTPVTAFFAAAPKVAAMFLFVRVMMEAFPTIIDQWQPVIWLIAALSMIVGSISALMQTNIKRLMAYSSIGHVGYALIGLAAGTATGVQGVIVYLGIYVLMTLGTFACILSMRRPEGMAENIDDLAGLSQNQPGLALAFSALMFSLAGIPPLLGFFGKLAVFSAGVESGLYILTVIGVLTSVISTYYYLRVLVTIWFSEPTTVFAKDHGPAVTLTASVSALLIVVGLVVILQPLTRLAAVAAQSLF